MVIESQMWDTVEILMNDEAILAQLFQGSAVSSFKYISASIKLVGRTMFSCLLAISGAQKQQGDNIPKNVPRTAVLQQNPFCLNITWWSEGLQRLVGQLCSYPGSFIPNWDPNKQKHQTDRGGPAFPPTRIVANLYT